MSAGLATALLGVSPPTQPFIHSFASPSTYPPFFPDTCLTYRGRSILLSIVLWIIEPQTTQPCQTWLSPSTSGLHSLVFHSPQPSPSFPFRPLSVLVRGEEHGFCGSEMGHLPSPHLLTPTCTYQPPHTSRLGASPHPSGQHLREKGFHARIACHQVLG